MTSQSIYPRNPCSFAGEAQTSSVECIILPRAYGGGTAYLVEMAVTSTSDKGVGGATGNTVITAALSSKGAGSDLTLAYTASTEQLSFVPGVDALQVSLDADGLGDPVYVHISTAAGGHADIECTLTFKCDPA